MNIAKTNFTMIARNRFNLTQQALYTLRDTKACIMILDDRSDEPTAELIRACGSSCTIRNDIPMGTGPLRNKVVSESERVYGRGDFLYLSDNDVFFTHDWLDWLIDCYVDVWSRGFRILGGYNHPFNQRVGEYQFIHNDYDHRVYEVNHLASQSMLMTWDAWQEFGPFVETPVDKVCQSEDVAFSNKIREAGYKVGVVSPWLVVNTGITNSFGEHIPGWELVKSQCPLGILCE